MPFAEDTFDHPYVRELHARDERFRKSEDWKPPSKWRTDWLDASPGLKAILPQEGAHPDPKPGEASSLKEKVRDVHTKTAIQQVLDVKSSRDEHCLRGTASRGLKTAQLATPRQSNQAIFRHTFGQMTPRQALLPSVRLGGACAETSSAKQGCAVARASSSSASQEPRARRRAARTSFVYMAQSPTFLHRDDICWFGQVEEKKAPSSARPLVAAGASTASASGTSRGHDFFWFGQVSEKKVAPGSQSAREASKGYAQPMSVQASQIPKGHAMGHVARNLLSNVFEQWTPPTPGEMRSLPPTESAV
mmetsp:Transcript_47472/g.86962  ORF Transcript_47472/g.86962 Transcript_47472/m.86962 type:complete len:305 (-) Transcript_47472:28-942(-)